jgi:hypothetical protein
MKSAATKNILNFLLILGISAFLVVGIFGMSLASDMKMKSDGTMGGCLFDGQAEICPMTIAEHLSRWQSMFAAIPTKADFLITLFALISAVGSLLLFSLRRRWLLLVFSRLSDRWRFYLKQNPNISLFNPLREAFSQGILNPKIYESATL